MPEKAEPQATILDRIKAIIDHKRMSQRAFANSLEVPPMTINSMFKRKSEPGAQLITTILEHHPEISPEWLLTGEGEMFINKNFETGAVPYKPQKATFFTENSHGNKFYQLENGNFLIKVPHVPFSAYGRFANENDTLEAEIDEWESEVYEVEKIGHGKYLSFTIAGDSMDNGRRESFEQGDKVLVRELDKIHWTSRIRYNEFPYWVVVFDTSVLVKQMIDQDLEKGTLTFHSLNDSPEYADFTLEMDNIRRLYYILQKKPKLVNY